MKKNQHSGSSLRILISAFLLMMFPPVTFSQQSQVVKGSGAYPPATVPNSEVRSFHSKILDRDMEIFIRLPLSYSTSTEKKYPAWYITDANLAFDIMANIVSVFEIPVPSKPEIILVGIGYKIRDMADWADYRTRDLTIVNVPATDENTSKQLGQLTGRQFDVKSGGAAKFLDFVTNELIPFVESDYRVSSTERYLGGYSYGGLFSLYTMLTKPELFTKYFAGSPSIWFGKGAIYNLENEFSSTNKDLNAKLCMTVGGLEDSTMISNMNRMAAILKSRSYPGFSVETFTFPGESHMSAMAASLMRQYVVLNKK